MKVFILSKANINEIVSGISSAKVVDCTQDISILRDIVEFIDVSYLIIDTDVDGDFDTLLTICQKAQVRNIRIVLLVSSLYEYIEAIKGLNMLGVNAVIEKSKLTQSALERVLLNYPTKLNINLAQIADTSNKASFKRQIVSCMSGSNDTCADILSQLAIVSSQSAGLNTLLVNLNSEASTVEAFFGLDIDKCINSIKENLIKGTEVVYKTNTIQNVNVPTADSIKSLIQQHGDIKELHLLPWFIPVEAVGYLDKGYTETILNELTKYFDLVILHLSSNLRNQVTREALNNSDFLCYFLGTTEPSIYTGAQTINSIIQEELISTNKIKLATIEYQTAKSKVSIGSVFSGIKSIATIKIPSAHIEASNCGSIFALSKDFKTVEDGYTDLLHNIGYPVKKKTGLKKFLNR